MSGNLDKYLESYEKDQAIITEGEQDTDFFCLVQGKLSVWKGSEKDIDTDETPKLIRMGEISEKGSYFGEMSYFLKEPRSATIKCDTDAKVLKFPGTMLPELMTTQPELSVKMCKSLAERLKDSTSFSHKEALGKMTMRTDAADQGLYAKESFQKVFMMLSAIQVQFQHPLLKLVIEYMTKNRLLQGGRKIILSDEALQSFPLPLVPLLKKLYG